MKKVICECCNKAYDVDEYIAAFGYFGICPFCGWENDPTITAETSFSYSSANKCSITEHKNKGESYYVRNN